MKKQKRESQEEGGEKEDGVEEKKKKKLEKGNKGSLKTTSWETSKRYKCLKE